MKKLLIAMLTCACATCCAVGIAACDSGSGGGGGNNTHTNHVYDKEVAIERYLLSEATCTEKAVYFKSCECGEGGGETFEYGEANGHNFVEESTSAKYLKSEADCTHKAVYFKYCNRCGETGEETFEVGDAKGHVNDNGVCASCGEKYYTQGLSFTLDNGSYTVTGYGTARDTDIYIPETYEGLPVTAIGDKAFTLKYITGVTIPDGVTKIGENAFNYCEHLKSAIIPDSVTFIGCGAFGYCYNLKSINIPNKLTSIEQGVFSSCRNLESVIIPETVTSIGQAAFSSCEKLESVIIPEAVTSIGQAAFSSCEKLESVIIPDQVTQIGKGAFSRCIGIKSITVGSGVTTIEPEAFADLTLLTEMNFNAAECEDFNYADEIFRRAGYGTEGATLNIGANVKRIPAYFTSMRYGSEARYIKFTRIIFAENGVCESIGSYAFFECPNVSGELILPDSLTEIETYAFYWCNIESLTIGKGVKTIGDSAFLGNYLMTKINFNATECEDLNDRNDAFGEVGSNGDGITLTVGASVKKIPARLFSTSHSNTGPKITGVVFEKNGVCKSIGESAFIFCAELKDVYYNGTAEEWEKVDISSTGNDRLTNANCYYYSETRPAVSGNFWHYVDGEITVW